MSFLVYYAYNLQLDLPLPWPVIWDNILGLLLTSQCFSSFLKDLKLFSAIISVLFGFELSLGIWSIPLMYRTCVTAHRPVFQCISAWFEVLQGSINIYVLSVSFLCPLGATWICPCPDIWGNPLIYRAYITHKPGFQSISAWYEALQGSIYINLCPFRALLCVLLCPFWGNVHLPLTWAFWEILWCYRMYITHRPVFQSIFACLEDP